MPSHADRVRTAPLPAGYQFGDARTRALTLLPDKPILPGVPRHILVVEVAGAAEIEAGIRELARVTSQHSIYGYARLDTPVAVEEVRFYGPVRFHRMFSPFPAEGSPRMRSFLTLGLLRVGEPQADDDHRDQHAVAVAESFEHFESDEDRHRTREGAES